MDLGEITGMEVGERKSVLANGRYKVGQVLYDDNPYVEEVLRVVEVSRPTFWGRDRINDEDEFHRRPGDVTTNVVVERVKRSPAGRAAVDAFRGRYGEPVKAVGGELRVNARERAGEGVFLFGRSGEVRALARDRPGRHPALTPTRSESVSGFGPGQLDRVYDLPADGWYEADALCAPTIGEQYFFRLAGGRVAELVSVGTLARHYGMHWRELYEAETRFRDEHGV